MHLASSLHIAPARALRHGHRRADQTSWPSAHRRPHRVRHRRVGSLVRLSQVAPWVRPCGT